MSNGGGGFGQQTNPNYEEVAKKLRMLEAIRGLTKTEPRVEETKVKVDTSESKALIERIQQDLIGDAPSLEHGVGPVVCDPNAALYRLPPIITREQAISLCMVLGSVGGSPIRSPRGWLTDSLMDYLLKQGVPNKASGMEVEGISVNPAALYFNDTKDFKK